MHTHALLPGDLPDNRLLGRLWDPESQGPRLVTVRSGWLHDVSALLERDDLTACLEAAADATHRPNPSPTGFMSNVRVS